MDIQIQCNSCFLHLDSNSFLDNFKYTSKKDPTCIKCRIQKLINSICSTPGSGNFCSKCHIEQSREAFFTINNHNKGKKISYHCKCCEAILKIIKKINKFKECIVCKLTNNNFDLDLFSNDYLKNICRKCEKPSKFLYPSFKKCITCNQTKNISLFLNIYSECSECLKTKIPDQNFLKKEKERLFLKRQIYYKTFYNKVKNKSKLYVVKKSISHSVYRALKKNNKHKNKQSIFTFLPYTLEQLRNHLESQFESWMSWDNWGKFDYNKKTWQIDHIQPHSSFNYFSMEDEEFKQCWALTNLRPLLAVENLRKSNKIN